MIAYRLFESAASVWNHLRGGGQRQPGYIALPGQARPSLRNLADSFACRWKEIERGEFSNALMVYAATIGEFHPLRPVIDNYLQQRPGIPLVILSGQLHVQALQAAYPQAAVGVPPPSAPWLYDRLFTLVRPCLVAVGEGPCLLSCTSPSRWNSGFRPHVRHSTPMVVVNATMFPYTPSSKLDRIEYWLFGSIYKDAIRYWYTQNDIFRSWLLQAKVPADRIIVTGDLRFDAQRDLGARSTELADLLSSLARAAGPTIVAGSVNALDEEAPVIDGWLEVRKKYPQARLIMAPRHVNNSENMSQLYDYFEHQGSASCKTIGRRGGREGSGRHYYRCLR